MAITYAGSLCFGPLPDNSRNYTYPATAIPANGQFTFVWIGVQADKPWGGDDPTTASGLSHYPWGRGTGTGGNDCWLRMQNLNNGSGGPARVSIRLASSASTPFASGSSQGGSAPITWHEPWSIAFTSDGATWSLMQCKRGGTAATVATGTYNTAFNGRPMGTITAGVANWAGRIQAVGFVKRATTLSEFEQLANGTDPESIYAGGDRADFIAFNEPAATVPNLWTPASPATRVGDWSGLPASCAPTVPNAAAYIDCAEHRPWTPVALPWGQGPSGAGSLRLSGTYVGFTPSTLQGRVVRHGSPSTVVQDWTDLTSFAASAGAWSGRLSVPAGGEYLVQLRDKVDTAKAWAGGSPFAVVPVYMSDGQSPHAILFTDAKGGATLTGRAYYSVAAYDGTYVLVKATSANLGVGFVAAANEFAARAGGTHGVFFLPAAVPGTSSGQWAAKAANIWPRVLAHVDVAGRPEHVSIWWLNGAADSDPSQVAANQDAILANYDADLTATRGMAYRRVMIPHNRDTSHGMTDHNVRAAQWAWTTGHAQFGSKVFMGPASQDMQIDLDQVSTGTAQAATATTVTLAAGETFAYTTDYYVKITGGTGAGQVRKFTAVNNTTKTYTVAAWTTAPDATSTYRTFGQSPHQNAAGSLRVGPRIGRALAFRHDFTALSGQGPSVISATYPSGGAATTVTATVAHVHGAALRTVNGGTSAATVFGFEGSSDGGTTWARPASAAISGAATVALTFASPVNRLRYNVDGGSPVAAADVESLGDVLYDDTGIGDTGGLPVWFTPSPLTVTAAAIPPTAGTLTESSHTTTTVTLQWTAGSGTGTVTSQLQWLIGGVWTDVAGATASPYTHTGLAPATAYEYRVKYADANGVAYSGGVSVDTDAQVLTSIAVDPPTYTIATGGQRQFTATGTDQFGNAQTIAPTWSVHSGGGSITSGGVYTAPATGGLAAIRATVDSVYGAATVTIESPIVYPDPSDVRMGVYYGPSGEDYVGTLVQQSGGLSPEQLQQILDGIATAATNAASAATAADAAKAAAEGIDIGLPDGVADKLDRLIVEEDGSVVAGNAGGGGNASEVASAVVLALAGHTVEIVSPILDTGTIELYAGDDYSGAQGIAFVFTDASLVGESVSLRLLTQKAYGFNNDTTLANVESDGVIELVAGVPTAVMPLTASQTATLTPARGGDGQTPYRYQLIATSLNRTLADGKAIVRRRIAV